MIGAMPQQLGVTGAEVAPAGPQAPPTVGGLLPQAQPEQGAPAQPTSMEDHAEAVLQQFRDLSMQVMAMARQYPGAAQDLATANDALINAMSKVVASLSAESESAPPILS